MAVAAAPDAPRAFTYGPGSEAVAMEPFSSPEAQPSPGLAFQAPRLAVGGGAHGAGPWTTYARDWLETRARALFERRHTQARNWAEPALPSVPQAHHGGLLAHGCSFNFMPSALSGAGPGRGWQGTTRLEVHFDRHSVQLGVRLR